MGNNEKWEGNRGEERGKRGEREIKGGDKRTITGNKNRDKDEEILKDEKIRGGMGGGNKLKENDRDR